MEWRMEGRVEGGEERIRVERGKAENRVEGVE